MARKDLFIEDRKKKLVDEIHASIEWARLDYGTQIHLLTAIVGDIKKKQYDAEEKRLAIQRQKEKELKNKITMQLKLRLCVNDFIRIKSSDHTFHGKEIFRQVMSINVNTISTTAHRMYKEAGETRFFLRSSLDKNQWLSVQYHDVLDVWNVAEQRWENVKKEYI